MAERVRSRSKKSASSSRAKKPPSDARSVERAVAGFAKAVLAGDFKAFVALHHPDVRDGLDEELFSFNAKKAAKHRFKLAVKGMTFEGDVAEATVTITPGDGDASQRDEALFVLVRSGDAYLFVES